MVQEKKEERECENSCNETMSFESLSTGPLLTQLSAPLISLATREDTQMDFESLLVMAVINRLLLRLVVIKFDDSKG